MINPEKCRKYPSHRLETHTADLKPRPSKIPRKTSMINLEKRRKQPSHRSETHAADLKPTLLKIPIKTKTKPKLKQRHQSKPIQKKSSPEPPSELPIINPTDPPTDQPIQTHHQPILAHRSKPSSLIHADPTSKIQNPALVRDRERK